ncbi:uncharacterized protein TRIADDRAFT_61795 [Trichoplax adhaerens]|uniref:Uncharacterized protein n=1 Tax=Trichoplax adhaerens TaxID=10228 RepID=B3SBZ7_TRIAD|nr:hypothetical protein TRIADDRAFT_61795 [Trichoplax adhaerens]EDV19761.1 hypothetical protein TRIADDRAFT_61795 [Trichoplax adhaerens]|eukprot:XP_002117785.1 hypothetical protein TRIADDRAFT_61795 [Trichoplax adhaerens]
MALPPCMHRLGISQPDSMPEVSLKWQMLAENDQLWKLKCKESKIVDIPVQTTLTHSASAQALWKRIFQTNLTLRKNWERGRCRVLEVSGHSNRIWNSSTGMLLQTLKGHTRGIWAIRFYGRNSLVSSSYDGSIKIWNIKSGACLKTLYSHNGPVWAIERKGDLLLSGSQDKTAKLWDIRRHRLLLTLSGHTAAVFAVDIDDSISIALTGSADRSIRLWNIINGDCHRIIWAGHASSVMAVNINMGFIASSSDTIITLWNAKTGDKVRQYLGHSRRIECLQLRMTDPDNVIGYIVSAGRDGFVKYWDIKEGTCIQTLRGHMDVVNSIHFDELRIASASYDHEIKIWDFNVDTDSVNVTPKR